MMFFLMAMVVIGMEVCWQQFCWADQEANVVITIKELSCEYAQNPLGIETPAPRFSWILESNQREQMQSAYRILVASNAQKLEPGATDKWDSGKVNTDKSVNVPYEGTALSSGEKCYWKVRVWGKNGRASNWSEAATFEMGLLSESDWQGKWIGMKGPEATLSYVDSRFGQAVHLNGNSEAVEIEHYARLKPANQISISAWIKPVKLTDDWQHIYRKDDRNTNDGLQLLALDTDTIYLGLSIAGSYTEDSAKLPTGIFNDAKWHWVAATYDGSCKRIYLDGTEIGSKAVGGLLNTGGSSPAYIGSNMGRSGFFTGGIDDVRIYDCALSAGRIKAMASGTDDHANLIGWWKLDGNLNNSVDGANGKVVGTLTIPPSPLLRKEFSVSKKIERARVYISGIGWNELYINGKKVGDHVLDPATTDYDKYILYETYDVSDMLTVGANAIGVMLGNGWYSEPPPYCNRRYGDSPRLLMQMNIEFFDGSSMSVSSDDSWKNTTGPIIRNDLWGGETYDARLEKPGWTNAGYDDSDWDHTMIKQHPGGKLVSQLMPAIKVNQTIKPVRLTNPKPDVYVYDLGQYFGGWTTLRMKGPKGTKVSIKYSPLLSKDNSGLLWAYDGSMETDYYILKGDPAGEVYEPRFTFHPVRYVQIEGYPGKPTLNDLIGRVTYNSIDMSGHFSCSNPLFNQIHKNVVWTLTNVLFGIVMECLHREPWSWLDPENLGTLYVKKYMPLFWLKYLNDAKCAQHADGVIPDVVPNYPRKGRTTGDPAWAGNYPLVVWYLHQYYDDYRILEEHYDSMKKWLDHLTDTADGYLINKGYYGDHMVPGPQPGKEIFIDREGTPSSFLWTGYYYRDASIVSQTAKILKKDEEAKRYAELANNIKDAINKKWLNLENNRYATGSQTSNLFPLALGIVPEAAEDGVVMDIVKNIVEKYDGHLHTGNIGTNCLVSELTERGFGNVMYEVTAKTTYPGWGYMVSQGATTIWENWGGLGIDERCMQMFCTIDEFFYSGLAGIQGPDYYGPGYMTPGFRQIEIKPHILGDLTYASGSIRTVRGMVSSSWKRTDDSLAMEVAIPVNSQARISVPKIGLRNIIVTESGKAVWQKGKFLREVEGIISASESKEYITFTTGSGSYSFRISGA